MPFAIGETVGPYQIVEQLGQGGMATVFKAYHASLDRYVALKVLHPNLYEDPTFTVRFQREAKLVAKIDHPNIVPVHDFAEHDRHPYLVMKFIEGGTLKERLGRGPLTSEEIGDVLESVGSALTYAHQQGILHRDIKPSNVLIATDGHVYLADFGLARLAQDGSSTFSSDSIMGTPQYISPEQAIGKKDLDEGTDIYSFGVMLYEMVVGQVPFNADTPFSIIFDHIYKPLPMPRTINPSVPESVEAVLVKALAKERADRYATVAEMVSAFRSAWEAAGAPMQGTAVILGRETGKTTGEANAVVTGSTHRAEGSAGNKSKKKLPLWAFVSLSAALVICCVSIASTLGLLNRFWPALAPPTVTVTPTESVYCTGEQTWLKRDYFPEQEILHCWEQDHYITDLAYDGSEWTLVMTREVSYTDQAYLTDENFPETEIKEYWDRGFEITTVYYGNGQWIVVMSDGTGFTNQAYLNDSNFPSTDINDYWGREYGITTLGYGNGNWVVVMSKGGVFGKQVYFSDAAFSDDKIGNYSNADYYITNVAYGNTGWVVVMSQGNMFSHQYYYDYDYFPEDGITEDWDNNYFITNLAYGDSLWVVITSKP